MDIARCLDDGRTYNAYEFAALPANELGKKRRSLICDECKGPAFFRRASRSGQAACFGARPHAPGCEAAAAEARTIVTHLDDDEPRLNPGSHIVVDFRFGGQLTNGIDGDDNGGGGDGAGGARFTGTGGARTTVSHRRPSGLLRMLVESEDFRASTQTIEVPGHIQGIVSKVFVPFEVAARDEFVEQYRGYWGFVTDGARGGDSREVLWLNSGGRQDLSVLVPADLVGRLYERYGIQDVEDFAGVYLLVFGHLRKSARSKYYVTVDDVDACVLYSPAD